MIMKMKKGAVNLIAIVVTVVIVSALSVGVFAFLSTKTRETSKNEINQMVSTIQTVANENRGTTPVATPCPHNNLSGISVGTYSCNDCGATITVNGGAAEPQ